MLHQDHSHVKSRSQSCNIKEIVMSTLLVMQRSQSLVRPKLCVDRYDLKKMMMWNHVTNLMHLKDCLIIHKKDWITNCHGHLNLDDDFTFYIHICKTFC